MDSKPMLIMVLLLLGVIAGVIVYGTHKPVALDKSAIASVSAQPKSPAGKAGVTAVPVGAAAGAPAASTSFSSSTSPIEASPASAAAIPEPSVATQATPAIQERKPLIPGPDETDGEPVPAPGPVRK